MERLSGKGNFKGHVLFNRNIFDVKSIAQQKKLVKGQICQAKTVLLDSKSDIIQSTGRNNRTYVLKFSYIPRSVAEIIQVLRYFNILTLDPTECG